jgi:hypothetical protein
MSCKCYQQTKGASAQYCNSKVYATSERGPFLLYVVRANYANSIENSKYGVSYSSILNCRVPQSVAYPLFVLTVAKTKWRTKDVRSSQHVIQEIILVKNGEPIVLLKKVGTYVCSHQVIINVATVFTT